MGKDVVEQCMDGISEKKNEIGKKETEDVMWM